MSKGGHDSRSQPSPCAGASGTAPDFCPVAEVVPKSAGGFEVEPSKYILKVSRQAFMSRMSGCWAHWDDIPVHIKNAIVADMMAAVRVEPDDMDVFMNHWNQKLRKNYRDTLSKAKKAGKKPEWMGADVWAELLQLWDTPASKELSARNSANRKKNPAVHRGGSKSFQQHRTEMRKRYNRDPTLAETFTQTHAIEQTDADGNVTYIWPDDKSRTVMERYEAERQQLAQSTGREELTLEESNRIWDSIIDPASRNRRYSFGNMGAMTGYRRSQAEEEIATLKQQIEEINDWRKSGGLTRQLDEYVAAYFSEHGRMPGEDGSEDDEDDS